MAFFTKLFRRKPMQGLVEALIEFTDADLDKLKKLDEAFDRGNWPRDLPPDHASV